MVVSSSTPIFKRDSTDFGINFEMGELEKFIKGNLNLREELDTFFALKNFIFHDA